MFNYLRGKLLEICEELNDLVYDLDRMYYDELILRHRMITNVLYMSREYKDVKIFKAVLKDRIRLEQIARNTYTKRYFDDAINYEELLDLTNESNIVTDVFSDVVKFIESHE